MQWSSATPGLLVIMIDQSGTMTLPYDGDDSRSQFATKALNRVINAIIQKNFNGTTAKDRCKIVVIGYGYDAVLHVSGFLSELKASPIRVDVVKKLISDGNGGVTPIDSKMPVWLDPIPETCRETTNMMDAFRMAKDIVSDWAREKHQNPAPIIINISDGMPYDGRPESECMAETINIVREIKNIETIDGYVQVFNAMIGEGAKVVFPTSSNALDGEEAKFLYDISTDIPDSYQKAAAKNQLSYSRGARGVIYNADAEYLIKFINFGSSVAQVVGGDKD